MKIAYVPAIALPAGESKHGLIGLVEPDFPVVIVCPKDETRKTVIGNIMEMKARGASVITVVEEGDESPQRHCGSAITHNLRHSPPTLGILHGCGEGA